MKTQKILMISLLMLISVFIGCNPPSGITTLKMITLHDAVISNDIEKVNLDISRGAWINLTNKSGQTALHLAVTRDNPNLEIIQLLIDKGADINVRDKRRNQTPLHFAAKKEKKQAVELLLENNADPYKKDISGKTPKQLAANKEILDLFHKYGY